MTNPIDNGLRLNNVATGSVRQNGAAGAEQKPQEVAGKGQGYDTGVESERLQLIKEKIDSTPDIDIERIEAIKQRIAAGDYPIDPEQIADKFAQLEGLLRD